MSFCTPIFALQVSVSNETIESKILQSSTTPEGVWTQPMPTVGWTIIAPVPPLLKFTFGVWTYINNYKKYYFLLIWYDSCMVRYTPFIVLFKISGFCAILDFGFDCIDRKSSKFTKELICKRRDRWVERRVFSLKRTESDSPALCHTKRRVSVSITKSCFIRKTLKLRLRKKPKKITCFREIFILF